MPLESKGKNSLVFILGIVVAAALLMIAVTTTVFLKSGAYTTVKQIQIGSRMSGTLDGSGIDVTSPIKAADIDVLSDSVHARIQMFDDSGDFNADDVSDAALGLNR